MLRVSVILRTQEAVRGDESGVELPAPAFHTRANFVEWHVLNVVFVSHDKRVDDVEV